MKDCGAAAVAAAFPMGLHTQERWINEGGMSGLSAAGVENEVRSHRVTEGLIYYVEVLAQETGMNIKSPLVPYSSAYPTTFSCLWSKFSLLIRETFSQANFLRINTFLTFRWILNVQFLRSFIQNPNPRPSLMLMRSELLLSKREIGGDSSRLKMIHRQQSPV